MLIQGLLTNDLVTGSVLAAGPAVATFHRHHLRTKKRLAELELTRTRLADDNARLSHAVSHDFLTGLMNRQGLFDHLEAILRDEDRINKVAVLFLDIDRFKGVNDSLGHAAGDHLLQTIAERLRNELPEGCRVGRLGGDEFVVVMSDASHLDPVIELATVIARKLDEPIELNGRPVRISTSIGVAIGPEGDDSGRDMIAFANAALHRAKHAGRNRVEVFTPLIRTEMQTRATEEDSLRRSIEAGDVVPFFQPEYDATNGSLIGAEILARWLRNDGTITTASVMLALADDASTLDRLTAVVMKQAAPIINRLTSMGLPSGFRFRVNLPHVCTPSAWRAGYMGSYFDEINLPQITIDVREAAVTTDLDTSMEVLADLRSRGARICLEVDAVEGTSLQVLRSLPLDEIRVDRTHVDSLATGDHDRSLVRTMVNVAMDMGLTVSADGVESGPQADALLALGCSRHQGHLYSPAVTAWAIEDLVVAHSVDSTLHEFMS